MEKIRLGVLAQLQKPLVRHSTIVVLVILVLVGIYAGLNYFKVTDLNNRLVGSMSQRSSLEAKLASVSGELSEIKDVDQVKLNQKLEGENKQINEAFKRASSNYEQILDLRALNVKYDKKIDQNFSLALNKLSARDYSAASSTLREMEKLVQVERDKLKPAAPAAPSGGTASNAPPGSGYQRQSVHTDKGDFTVDIVAGDLNYTRVIVDTASDSDCSNNCPVMSLADYVSRSGAYAGINGGFFCPAEYPSCAGKTNSFDTLLMNKNKHYFNSENNVYSTVPVVIFSGSSARFVGQSLEWGRDTGVDAVLANYPLYISGGNNNFGGSSDPKINSKGSRTFVANKGSMVYIGIVYSAGAQDAAAVLKTLGMENALGLDQGGSTALWSGKYIAGPGRGLPAALLFVRK